MATAVDATRDARIRAMKVFHSWSKKSGKTQKQIADLIGVHPRFLRKLFAGVHAPNDDIYNKARQLMGLVDAPKKVAKRKTTRGRKAATWSVVTWDEVERFRVARNITNKEMAALCEVTNSTFHNWKRGTCAPNPSTQKRIRELLNGTRGQYQPVSTALHDAQINAVRTVVCAYIKSNPEMTPDDLIDVVGAVAGSFRS